MSTGPGRTQRRIIDALQDGAPHAGVDLAAALGISAAQLRRAAHSLQARGLARVTGTNRLFLQKPEQAGYTTIRVNVTERVVGGGTHTLRQSPPPAPTTPEQVAPPWDDDTYAERVAAMRADWLAAVHPVDRSDDAVDLDT